LDPFLRSYGRRFDSHGRFARGGRQQASGQPSPSRPAAYLIEKMSL
jgi:hypothetical protein